MIRFLLPAAGLALAGSVALAHPAHQQPNVSPPRPEKAVAQPAQPAAERNLQVFPRDITQERLMAAMQDFSRALGVQCSYCHVPGNFASDDNPHKEMARGMMRLTARLNQELLPAIPGLHRPRVSCFTCHGGAASPAVSLPAPGEPRG
jgi:sugar phosphate isomerase/epimerase